MTDSDCAGTFLSYELIRSADQQHSGDAPIHTESYRRFGRDRFFDTVGRAGILVGRFRDGLARLARRLRSAAAWARFRAAKPAREFGARRTSHSILGPQEVQ
jgi:hypothetical protein